jgi:aldose 1-epimerase
MPDGQEVYSYKIEAGGGRCAELLEYGATLQALLVPDRDGKPGDIVQGFASLEGHLLYSDYQGQTVGRYANRLERGFSLGGHYYPLPVDENGVLLHGGGELSHALWRLKALDENSVTLGYSSEEGSFGFPARVDFSVRFGFDGEALSIDYSAKADAPTVLCLTNHTYWNLDCGGDILSHSLQADCSRFMPVDSRLLPLGGERSVEGTPFDFREEKEIGRDIFGSDEQLKIAGGYDHHFCLSAGGAVRVRSKKSGRVMTMRTDMPGFQLYSGNFLSGKKGKGGPLFKNSGLCLESQFPPNSPNSPQAEICSFGPQRPYRSGTVYSFGVE